MTSWPKLDYDAWRDSGAALHLWLQIVGKYRLAATPWLNHSWHATFYITPRGLSTGVIHHPDASVDFEFDFRRHQLIGRSSALDDPLTIDLEPMSVAQFHAKFIEMTEELGAAIPFHGSPNEVPEPVPFAEDDAQRPYDEEIVAQHIRALQSVDRVLRSFRTGYLGKVSPVHLFWGSFDLAVTRFSGNVAPPHPGGIPALPDDVTREAYSHEVSSAGFWFGGGGIDEAAFYSYAYPTPDEFSKADVQPDAAYFFEPLGEFVLTYEAVRTSPSPDEALMAFLQSTWEAASRLGDWPHASLECPVGEALSVRRAHVPEIDPDHMSVEHIFDHQGEEEHGRYTLRVEGIDETAVLTYTKEADGVMIIERTEVPAALKELGLGVALAHRVVQEAREQGLRIVAVCPFFRSHVKRHESWRDVVR